MKFKYYFNNLPLRDKVLSFILIPLILSLLFIAIEKKLFKEKLLNINNQILVYEKAIKKLKNKKFKLDKIKSIQYIEETAKFFNVKIPNIKIDKSYFSIIYTGNYQNIINFLNTIEKSMKIKSLQILKSKEYITLEGVFEVKQLFVKNKEQIKDIPNPFDKIKEKNNFIKKEKLKLLAIIGENVCINDKWYLKNEKVGKYKIKSIFRNYIELQSKEKIVKLRILKNEK